jgi:hypothetical protein
MTTVTLNEAVGSYAARTRAEHGATLDRVAGLARPYGATWSASSVRNIEQGTASLGLTTLLHLALALQGLTGRPHTLSDLLGDAEAVYLGNRRRNPVRREWFDRVLAGAELALSPDDVPEASDWEGGADEGEPSLAEQRASKRLGITPERLQRWAERLWGHALDAEAARRAGDDSTPQARGRVTRILVQEVRNAIDEEER